MGSNEFDLLRKQGLDTDSMKLKLLSIKGMMNLICECIEERLELLKIIDDFDTEIPLVYDIVYTLNKIARIEYDTTIVKLGTLYSEEREANLMLESIIEKNKEEFVNSK